MFKAEGAGFLPKYEEFLGLAGSDTAENVVKRTVGSDIERPHFWMAAIESLEDPLRRLQTLAPRVLPIQSADHAK
jgi:oligoendopeptidase F